MAGTIRRFGISVALVAGFMVSAAQADEALDAAKADIAATLGPNAIELRVFPDAFLASTWAQNRAWLIDNKATIPPKYRALIGLAVSSQIPCQYCIYADTSDARVFGATDEEMKRAAKLASLDAFIESLPDGYATVVGERGLKLSGGQRQRVALARAFIRDPKILILDEPTSNLDSRTEDEIQRALETLMKGRTTFIIAHRLRTVRDADRILVLKGGRIVEQGRHDELAAKDGAYAALLRSQGGLVAKDEMKEDEKTAG